MAAHRIDGEEQMLRRETAFLLGRLFNELRFHGVQAWFFLESPPWELGRQLARETRGLVPQAARDAMQDQINSSLETLWNLRDDETYRQRYREESESLNHDYLMQECALQPMVEESRLRLLD